MSAGKPLKPGQVLATHITTGQSGIHSGTALEHGAAYRVDEAWGGGAILKKLVGSETRQSKLPVSDEDLELFATKKKFGRESYAEGIARIIREARDVR
jgi:hypothetical protein